MFGSHRDISLLLGEELRGDTPAARRSACEAAFSWFGGVQWIASTSRRIVDADTHHISARVDHREDFFETATSPITRIVDRIGTGDAFAAGVLSGLAGWCRVAAEARLALSALKHATAGDQSRTTDADLTMFTTNPADIRR